MGMFSWFTQDTHHRIVNGEEHKVIMTDNKGRKYVEHCYEGYGVFGGKDYYELLAEMNCLGSFLRIQQPRMYVCVGRRQRRSRDNHTPLGKGRGKIIKTI